MSIARPLLCHEPIQAMSKACQCTGAIDVFGCIDRQFIRRRTLTVWLATAAAGYACMPYIQ